jgi:protein TonB
MPPKSIPSFSTWHDSSSQNGTPLAKALRLLVIAGIHIAVLAGMVLAVRPEIATDVARVYVRLIEPAPVAIEPPRPAAPVTPKPKPSPAPRPVEPVLAAAPEVASPSAFAVAPAPPAPPPAPVAAPSAPAAVTEARFDADYLHNPKPEYPWAARRRGEEGRVMLRVQVSAAGTAAAVDIGRSSGFPLLDQAAREAVLRWRFVPARRGSEAIESWVLVPIAFRLDN